MFTGIPIGETYDTGGVGSQNSAVTTVQHAGLILIHIFDIGVLADQFCIDPANFFSSFGHFPFQNIIDAQKNHNQDRHCGQPAGQILEIFFVIIRRIIDRLAEPFHIDRVIGPVRPDFAQPVIEFGKEFGIAATYRHSIPFRVDNSADCFDRIHGPQPLQNILPCHLVADHGIHFAVNKQFHGFFLANRGRHPAHSVF